MLAEFSLEAQSIWQLFGRGRQKCMRGEHIMKNPLDSLGQTILLGFVLTAIIAVLIPVIGG
jgi:hypothetical protein